MDTFNHRWCVLVVRVVLFCGYFSSTSADLRITASFDKDVLDIDGNAYLVCEAYDLQTQANYYVTIERTIFTKTEQLFINLDLLDRVPDEIRINVNDRAEPIVYRLSIRDVQYQRDAGTYNCIIRDPQGNVVHSASDTLQINHLPAEFNPRCSISGFDKSFIRQSGSEVTLSCFSDFGFPPVEAPKWGYTGCNGDSLSFSPTAMTASGAYYSELRVTLSNAYNGGSFFCTIRFNETYFSKDCAISFTIIGVTGCGAAPPALPSAAPTQSPLIPPAPEIPTTVSIAAPPPRLTASISPSLINNNDNAVIFCEAYGLATGYFVIIERQLVSRTELLFRQREMLTSVAGNIRISVTGSEPRMYIVSINSVNHQNDAGTYTCKIVNQAGIVEHSVSVDLMINRLLPQCSIQSDDKSLTMHSGSQVVLGCFIESDSHQTADRPVWSYAGCNGDSKSLPETQAGNHPIGYYSVLSVTLMDEDNGGSFICTVGRADATYSESCTIGAFTIIGVTPGCRIADGATITRNPSANNPLPGMSTSGTTITGPRITATFDHIDDGNSQSPLEPGKSAYLVCEAYELKSDDFVTIERTLISSSRTELLFENTKIWRLADDNIRLRSIKDGDPKAYTLSIGRVEARFDAGTYTCTIKNRELMTIHSASVILNIKGPETSNRAGGNETTIPNKAARESMTFSSMKTICLLIISSLMSLYQSDN